ncbi:MAG: hypothetical protein LBF34_02575 [Puniceicoccales bacterium]|jgi:hypothetical protein|nr:hypothetical protein [Puniceicoccales bacterium]
METKNLNKKIGCALIAASLLAASGVQGSSARDVGGGRTRRARQGNAQHTGSDNTRHVRGGDLFLIEISLKISNREMTKLYYPKGYSVSRTPGNSATQVVVFEGNEFDFRSIKEQGFLGFIKRTYKIGSRQVQILCPNTLKIESLSGGIFALPSSTVVPEVLPLVRVVHQVAEEQE